MLDLKGKRVLYIAPKFFGYEREIGDELRRRGAQVDHLLDRPFHSPLMKAITRFRRDWIIKAADRYYREQIEKLGAREYDLIFVVNGQTLSMRTLEGWRNRFPNARFLLYMWDSFDNRANALDNMRFFDKCFSFDKYDSAKHGLVFRPLFFSQGFEREYNPAPEFDISFIGTAHTDRYAVVAKLAKTLDSSVRTFWYLYLQAPWVLWVYKVLNRNFRGARKDEFQYEPLSKDRVQAIFNSSGAVLDIEHPRQTGLTMRTLETLGARKKLVTTNQRVREYDFYNPANICVIDREKPEIPNGFLAQPYQEVPPEIYQRYRLAGWMDDMLGTM